MAILDSLIAREKMGFDGLTFEEDLANNHGFPIKYTYIRNCFCDGLTD